MVIFHQRYKPWHGNHEKQPFVLVIQTKWMRELAMNITLKLHGQLIIF